VSINREISRVFCTGATQVSLLVLGVVPFVFASPSETSADDAFHDQAIAGVVGLEADAEVQLPLGRNIEINRREELVILSSQRKKFGGWSERTIVFQSAGDLLGEVVADLRVG
jgi:hypothetical protein